MSRLSREKKREQKYAGPTAVVVAPLDVHVRGGGTATIGGVPVVAADGEEIQRAVLSHLHRIALATGHPVLATVHDERIGYVVALRVDPDGSSHFTADPQRTAVAPSSAPSAPSARVETAPDTRSTTPTDASPSSAGSTSPSAPALVGPPVPAPAPVDRPVPPDPVEGPAPVDWPVPADAPASAADEQSAQPRRDEPTHLLRQVPEPVRDAAPTFPLRAVPERDAEQGTRSAPESAPGYAAETPAPGTVTAPTGVFGPPPTMDQRPNPDAPSPSAPEATSASAPEALPTPTAAPAPVPAPAPIPLPLPTAASGATSTTRSGSTPTSLVPHDFIPDSALDPDPDPGPKPTPARGFDAVAEAVLGDDPRTLHGDGGTPALLAEPLARINEAVRAGRTDTAAALAERTVLEASATLGPEHPEVLRLRELTAYIAYLAGDPLRSFHTSLDLARIHRRTPDSEAAYGNVQSAAAAWRAVRDPLQGLNLGTELLGLWTELTTEEGPAADDIEELESARARMLRLAGRARKAGA
ncbi:tetratricopeptide repeat protein [Streptomyces rishiriensis]|nr:tetratricopeptide repeat protein [Streptomyces rishiriensis]